MPAMDVPPKEISRSRAVGGDGNSNLFSPLTLISLAAGLCSVSPSPTPTLPSLPSSLSRICNRNKGQELSINELHRAYCGDNNSQLPKEGLFEEGSTWAGLEIPDTVSAVSIDGEARLMGPPNESMFGTLAPVPVKAKKKKTDGIEEGGGMMGPPSDSMFGAYSPAPVMAKKMKKKDGIEEGGGMMGPPSDSMFEGGGMMGPPSDSMFEGGGMMGPPSDSMFGAYSPGPVKEEKPYQAPATFQFPIEANPQLMSGLPLSSDLRNSQPRNQHLKKRIKPMSVTPLATTGPTVAPSSLPVAMLDISTRRRHNVSKRKRCREWPKQIWEYPKWPFLPPGTIDMEEKRVSELQRKSPPDPNSSHRPSRGLATGDEKVSLLFLPADESSMQLTRELSLTSRLELHVPQRKRLRQVTALLLEKWKAIPQPRLDRLRLLVPCLSQDKDRQVVVDKSAQMQSPKFASCWGESKMEWTISRLLDELDPRDSAIRVLDENSIEGIYFIALYVFGTVSEYEMGIIEGEGEVVLPPFSTDRRTLPSLYHHHMSSSNRSNVVQTVDVAARAQSDPGQQHNQMPQLTSINGAMCANSSPLFSSYGAASTPACDTTTTTKEHHTTTNQISFALGEDTCANLFSWNMQPQ